MKLVAAVVALLVTLPCAARERDHGGRLDQYVDRVHRATGPHRITGDCISACTIWLGYSQSCVMRNARLWFHSSYDVNTPKRPDAEGNAILMTFYPIPVQKIVLPWLVTTQLPIAHSLSGRQLIALGVPQCR